MTARDRFPDLESCTDWPEINRQTIEVLDALDRAEADADRLADTGDHAASCGRPEGWTCTCGWTEAKAIHDEAVAQR